MDRLTLEQARILLATPMAQLTPEQRRLLPKAVALLANSGLKRPAHG